MSAAPATRFVTIRQSAARREHGSRARYVSGCRCLPCRAANSRYECRRAVMRLAGKANGIVSAERTRQHLLQLSRCGVGRHTVSKVTRISDSILFGIASGSRRRCRAETERRVLAVDKTAAHGKALVDARPTWGLLDELLQRGYSKSQLAAWLGSKSKTPALQLQRNRVTAENARKVRQMYEDLQAGRLRRP